MKEKNTDQINFFAMPIKTIERFNDFENRYKKTYGARKTSRSGVGAMVLEMGMDVGDKEIEKKLKQKPQS